MSSSKIRQKKVGNEIAAIMNSKGYDVSGRQCMTRINTMKRTYKTIKDHNSRSGNNKRTWKYYDVSITLEIDPFNHVTVEHRPIRLYSCVELY